MRDPLKLLAQPNAIVVTRQLLDRTNLEEGAEVAVRIPGSAKHRTLRIRGILEESGLGSAFGGQVAVADVYNLQAWLGRSGFVDAIDVRVSAPMSRERARAVLEEIVAGTGSVRPAESRDEWLDEAIRTSSLAANTIASMAFIAAGLFVVGAFVVSAERQHDDLALLSAVGLTRPDALRVLTLQASMLATIGAGLGLLLGFVLSGPLTSALANLSGEIEHAEPATASWTAVVAALGSALSLGLLASLAAGIQVTGREAAMANQVRVGGRREVPGSMWLWLFGTSSALLLALQLVSFNAELVDLIATVGAASSAVFSLVFWTAPRAFIALRPVVRAAFGSVGDLVGPSLASRPLQTAVSIAAATIMIATTTAALCVVASLTFAIDDLLADYYRGGVRVVAPDMMLGTPAIISKETIDRIKAVPGVRGVSEGHITRFDYEGQAVLVGTSTMSVVRNYANMRLVRGNQDEALAAVEAGNGILADEVFLKRHHKELGDRIELPTPSGSATFEIVGAIRRFSSGRRGVIGFDTNSFRTHWPGEGAHIVDVWASDEAIDEIERIGGGDEPLLLIRGSEMSRFSREMLGRFLRPLAALAAVVGTITIGAMMYLLAGSSLARRRELLMAHAVGATPGQITAGIVAEAGVLGLAAAALGLSLGLVWAQPMLNAFSASFAWTLSLLFPWNQLVALGFLVVAASLLGSVLSSGLALSGMRVSSIPQG